ncbi:DUF4097 family beta strand repeat-containing protein [Streptomyces sp. NPDC096030]|uniref:DUF4097 family beta strand repeat-containing protein n=1 Tax=Streptomyces sp. NPDC096030 TaxID=3155423 RepID=UPI0033181FF2
MNGRARAAAAGVCAFAVLGVTAACTVDSGNSQSREQAYEISEPVTALTVKEAAGKISIVAGEGPVQVKETLRFGSKEPATTHRVSGQTLQLEDRGCGSGIKAGRSCSVDYEIRVPASVAVTVATSAGEVSVSGTAGRLDLSASAGSIKGTDLSSPQARLRTSAGSVDASFARAPQQIDASAEAGDVTLRVPGNTSYAVDAKTELGTRKVSVPEDPGSAHEIRVRVSLGDLSVQTSP